MKKYIIALASFSMLLGFAACTKEEALVIQGVDGKVDGQLVNGAKQTEEYFASIREYEKSKHVIAFGFYTAWHALEGSVGEVSSPASWAQRLVGLPDSTDIVDLWMGIPTLNAADTAFGLEVCPNTIADMRYCQEKLGTKFVSHEDMSHNQKFTWGTYIGKDGEEHPIWYDIWSGRGASGEQEGDLYTEFKDNFDGEPKVGYDDAHCIGGSKGMQEACVAYAHRCIHRMRLAGLDGVDYDYEPNGKSWTNQAAAWVAEASAPFIGPETGKYTVENFPQKDTTKLLMFNFFGENPGAGVEPYSNYIVNQCYAWQIGAEPSSWVGRKPGWCPSEKFILNDSIGGEAKEGYLYGGKPSHYMVDGVDCKMYSMEAMARLVKDQGFAGFGAYYIDRNYNSASGIPYREFRRDICIANGAKLAPYFVE